jgi:hypothetical protein
MDPQLNSMRLVACGRAFGLGLCLSLVLAGCSTGAILADKLPESAGGLPLDAPARPQEATYQYPAVHDMPPERAIEPLTEAEQLRMEKELEKARDRLESKAEQVDGAAAAPKKPAKKPTKSNSSSIKSSETSGAPAKP